MKAEVYYTSNKFANGNILGYPTIDQEDKNCFAKLLCENSDNKYFLKTGNTRLLNPNSDIDFRPSLVDTFKWIRVEKEVFKQYLEFLRTGIERHLFQAERNML